MKKAFDHIGVWTTEPQAGERWVPDSEVWVTNPRKHPGRIEYLRPKNPPKVGKDQPGLWKLWNYPHVAYRVDSLTEAIKGRELVLGPFEPGGYDATVNAYFTRSNVDVGASFRQLVDVADWDQSVATNAPGQSEWPASPHFADLAKLWAAGEYFPLSFSDRAIQANAESTLTLQPR